MQESSSNQNTINQGPPPGVVTPSVQKRIITLLESGCSVDQIVLDSLVAEIHLTAKEVGSIVDEYESTKVVIPFASLKWCAFHFWPAV